MKQGLIVGWVALFIICIILNSIVESNTGMNTTQNGWITNLITPAGANNSGSLIAQSSIIIQVWDYAKTFIGVLFLWFPSLFSGQFFLVWLVFCAPVAVGFVWSIITIMRGVHAS